MKSYHTSPNSPFLAITGFILLVAVWINLAPVQFGGQAVYLIIDGVSMEPRFFTGDLVILHQTNSYEISDIAAYREPNTGGIIIHRIIGQDGERFTLLGDNKPRPDGYRPTLSEMVGRYWMYIPKLGRLASQFRVKDGALPTKTLLVELGLFILIIPLAGQQKRQHRRRKSRKEQTRAMSGFNLDKINKTDLALFLTALALASAAAAYFAFSAPPSRTVSDNESYEHHGTFSYSAKAPPGIYKSDMAQTGEPIFRTLINKVTVNFDYEFTSALSSNVSGTYRVMARISHSNGWNTTLELLPQTPFSDNGFSANTIVDLAQIQRFLDNLEQQTGLGGQSYRLAIVPEVSVNGVVNGQTVTEKFSPELAFDLSAPQMQLADSNLQPSQIGQLKVERQIANSLSILNIAFDVLVVRKVAIAGVVISVGSLLILGWLFYRANLQDEATRIQFKYGTFLLPVQASVAEESEDVVEMAAIDDLVCLAKQDGRIILHHANGTRHHYLVKDGATSYHYQTNQINSRPPPNKNDLPEEVRI
jgi:signal peptidase I